VLPQQKQASNRSLMARALLIEAPTLEAQATHEEAALLFKRHQSRHAIVLLQDQRPLGLISRKTVQDLHLQVFFRDIYGRRPCRLHANLKPLLVDIHTPIENLTEILTSSDTAEDHKPPPMFGPFRDRPGPQKPKRQQEAVRFFRFSETTPIRGWLRT